MDFTLSCFRVYDSPSVALFIGRSFTYRKVLHAIFRADSWALPDQEESCVVRATGHFALPTFSGRHP